MKTHYAINLINIGNTVVPQYADARVDIAKGVLICSAACELDSVDGCPCGIYHTSNISFYFYILRQNAENRVNKYFGK